MLWGLEHMEIKNRLFTHPVLCDDNDDYIDSEFYVKYDMKEEINDYVFSFDFFLVNNEELEFLIQKGLAELIIHIECSATMYRKVARTYGNNIKYRISKSQINKELVLLGAIVAKRNISEFKSKHLNEDYDEMVNFEEGEILAYYNLPKIFINKNYDEIAKSNNFFTIIKRMTNDEDEKHPVTYDITDDKIKILVDEEIFDGYVKFQMNNNIEPLIEALLIMPSVIYMIDTLRENDLENYKNLYWYGKIEKHFKLQEKSFEDIIRDCEKTSIEIAQEIFKLPINRSFFGLSKLMEE